MMLKKSTGIFFTIIVSQFCGTALWFAGNAVLPQLQELYNWSDNAIGHLTSSVQLGFILGTLLLSITGITDRFSPSWIFFLSSLVGAVINVACLLAISSLEVVLISRFFTGVALAGIYPVGMKIASDWNEKGLGHWLGTLVGALVLGTSIPHALQLIPGFAKPATIIIDVSIMAFIGGTAMLLLIKDGPYRKASNRFSLNELRKVFSVRPFQTAAFGYFGHMWELYAFWAFVPWLLNTYQALSGESFSIPLWSFLIIASGFLGCVLGGLFSLRWGSKPVALVALLSSGICCVLSFKMYWFPPELFFAFVLFWGFMVVADSPQFSALMAFYAPPQIRGTAITIATSIGFSITIFSIQLLNYLKGYISAEYLFIVLSLGPAFGILLLWRKLPV